MGHQGWKLSSVLIGFVLGLANCGGQVDSSDFPREIPAPIALPSVKAEPYPGELEVVGSAEFGSQCPYGSYANPTPVPVELWDCPINLSNVELTHPLPSLILQADCKKKTLDVRSADRAVAPATWEVMPDGNFYVTFDSGVAQLKDDGTHQSQCDSALVVSMWGRIDCQDRDHAVIQVETVWRLGVTLEDNLPSPSSSATPGPSVSPSANPSPSPSVLPSAIPLPGPGRVRPPRPVHFQPSHLTPEALGPSRQCQLPTGCYFHNITSINQCS